MDPILKQRLVGATILSALAVIFVPMIFEDSRNEPGTREFEIPEIPPDLKTNSRPSAKPPSDAELGLGSEVASKLPSDQSTPENPNDERSSSLRSWIIQVGSFSNEENANSLRDQLRKKGYPVYVESATTQGTVKFRVRVGPELDRQRALDQRDRIASLFKVKGIVLPVP
ncbi:MAG: SPOR domain-containing protein [Methylococcales bacterium]